MKRLSVVLLYFIFLSFFSLAQKITGDFTHSKVYENKKGFLVAGFSKEEKESVFNLIQYDKNLNEISKISQSVKKENYTCKTYPYGYEFFFSYNLLSNKGAFLKVDNDLKLLSFKEYDKEDIAVLKDAYKNPDPNNYYTLLSTMGTPSGNIIDLKDYHVELIFKDNPVITGYKRKQTELFQSYSREWELELTGYKVYMHHFYPGKDGRVYLYLRDEEQNIKEHLFCIDFNSGKLLFELKLELDDPTLKTAWSNMLVDEQDNSILIVGNYYHDDGKNKKGAPATMDGYFLTRMDSNGKVKGQKTVKFDYPITSNMKEDDLNRIFTCFQKITKNTKGNYQLIGENMRLRMVTVSGAPGGDNYGCPANSVDEYSSNISYQTFGFTFLEFGSNLNLIDSKYEPVKCVVNNQLELLNKKSLPNDALENIYYKNCLGIIFKTDGNIYDKHSYCVSNSNCSKLIYRDPKRFYVDMNCDNSEIAQAHIKDFERDTDENYPWKEFFEGDKTVYFLFSPAKNSFVLEKKNY